MLLALNGAMYLSCSFVLHLLLSPVAHQRTAISVAMTNAPDVIDLHAECADWAVNGECSANAISMLTW